MFVSTSDPTYNTNAPSGTLTNSGWQYEGQWGNFLGTPIAPTFFLAAKHVSGYSGAVFDLNGVAYHIRAIISNPSADFVLCQVAETFPRYAPLFTATNEVGRHCVVFGRGTQRGGPVVVSAKTNGWYWGGGDGVQRWGENIVASIETDPQLGDFLRCAFDRNGGSNECHLSVGDSSGALFIQDAGTWKLAGIHYSVDGLFSTDGTTNTQFNAALLDMGGLYEGEGTNWTYIAPGPHDIPSGFYSTRVSAHLDWISGVINFQPGSDLQITSFETAGNDVLVHLATGTNRLYHVDRRDTLDASSWTTFTNNVPGTGGIVTVIDAGAAVLPQRFYRVGLDQ
jgi:hypothetical protein